MSKKKLPTQFQLHIELYQCLTFYVYNSLTKKKNKMVTWWVCCSAVVTAIVFLYSIYMHALDIDLLCGQIIRNTLSARKSHIYQNGYVWNSILAFDSYYFCAKNIQMTYYLPKCVVQNSILQVTTISHNALNLTRINLK